MEYAGQAKGLFEQWIASTNTAYKIHVEKSARHQVELKRKALQQQAEFEEKRRKMLEQISIS